MKRCFRPHMPAVAGAAYLLFLSLYIQADCFTHQPGDQLWVMVNDIGNLTKPIVGCVTSITPDDIGTTGYLISQPGNYRLTGDVVFTGAVNAPIINILSSDVHLDLNNFTITDNSSVVGGVEAIFVNVDLDNIRIVNGSIIGTGLGGLAAVDVESGCTNVLLQNLTINGSLSQGIRTFNVTGFYVDNVRVTGCANNGIAVFGGMGGNQQIYITNSGCYNNGTAADDAGIQFSGVTNGFVHQCETAENRVGFYCNGSIDITLQDISSFNDDQGITVQNIISPSQGVVIRNAQVVGTTIGNGVEVATNIPEVTIISSVVSGSAQYGVALDGLNFNTLLQDVDIVASGTTGLIITDPLLVDIVNCFIGYNNGDGLAMLATVTYTYGINVDRCTLSGNLGCGFNAPGEQAINDMTLQNCNLSNNGFPLGDSSSALIFGQGSGINGLIVRSTIRNNTLVNNAAFGVNMLGTSNIIVDNAACRSLINSFQDQITTPGQANLYVGNIAAFPAALGFNYFGSAFSLPNFAVKGWDVTVGPAPVFNELTRWTNLNVLN